MAVWQWVAAGAVGLVLGAAGGVVTGCRRERGDGGAEPWVLRHSSVVVVVGAAGAIAAFVLTYRATAGAERDRFDVAIKAATAAGALAAGVLAWGRLELSRHEHRLDVDRDLTERYGRAVDQLASDDEVVRVGGVLALERFAIDAARVRSDDVDWRMALGTLAMLARKDSSRAKDAQPAEGNDGPAKGLTVPPATALEAVRVIGRFAQRSGRQLTIRDRLDLAGVIATGADLPGAHLVGARLVGATLDRADLAATRLVGATLDRADLTAARLAGADLARASLTGTTLALTDLTRAQLPGADLTHANLRHARLAGADLAGANLTLTRLPGADLSSADLTEAHLSGADLTRANLKRTRLTRARLGSADLTDADLTGADLSGACIVGADITTVRCDDTTVWPNGSHDPPPKVGGATAPPPRAHHPTSAG